MIRLLLADDHAIVREGLKQLFAYVPDMALIAEAGNGDQILSELRAGEPFDVLLLDLTMPGISGTELIVRIRQERPELPILVLSMHNEPQIAQRALKAGAAGYLTKDSEPETLLAAIRRVAAGRRFIDPTLAEAIALESSSMGPAVRHDRLSEREAQILRLLAQGCSINSIAETLGISNKTVSTHKARLMEKMNFTSNADLVRYAIAHGLAD